jgi:hypothetical protein
MNHPGIAEKTTPQAPERLAQVEEHIRIRLSGRIREFRLIPRGDGLVLHGQTHTYYAKQLAQRAVMEAVDLPIRGNEIEVV